MRSLEASPERIAAVDIADTSHPDAGGEQVTAAQAVGY